MNFQRARNIQAKAVRWDEIVNSTLSLFEKTSYANITIKDIAQKTSFTRGNIYKYISTKEEIFLEIIIRDSKKWINDLQKTISTNMEIDDFLELWCKTIYKHKRLIQLFTLLPFVIEKNVSLEKLAAFKSKFFKNLEPSTASKFFSSIKLLYFFKSFISSDKSAIIIQILVPILLSIPKFIAPPKPFLLLLYILKFLWF